MSSSSESPTYSEYRELKEMFVEALSGNEQRYADFLVKLRSRVDRYLMRELVDRDQREDLIQDVLLSIHLARHTYDSNKPFGPWLVSIIRRRIIDRFRSEKRFVADDIEEHIDGLRSESSVDQKLLAEQLINSLDGEQRAAVLGTEVFGRSTAEVADELKMTHGAFRVMLHRTLKGLRSLVEGQ